MFKDVFFFLDIFLIFYVFLGSKRRKSSPRFPRTSGNPEVTTYSSFITRKKQEISEVLKVRFLGSKLEI